MLAISPQPLHKVEKMSISKNKECQAGNHQFIVSAWQVRIDKQVMNGVICQKCLYHIEGLNEVRAAVEAIHVTAKPENENQKAVGKDIRDKDSQDSNRKK